MKAIFVLGIIISYHIEVCVFERRQIKKKSFINSLSNSEITQIQVAILDVLFLHTYKKTL